MSDPTKPFDYAEARKQDELLYEAWKKDPSKKNMGRLIHQMSPLIYKEVRQGSGSLPTEALAAETKKNAIRAVKTYDPSKGASLSTHVTSYAMKTRRMNYLYQNAARLPEDQQLVFHKWQRAKDDLEAENSREATSKELADRLGWTEKAVTRYQDRLFEDHYESGSDKPSEMYGFDDDGTIRLNYILGKLTQEERFVLDNVKSMSQTELADKMKMNINQLNYFKKKLATKIRGLKDGFGEF